MTNRSIDSEKLITLKYNMRVQMLTTTIDI